MESEEFEKSNSILELLKILYIDLVDYESALQMCDIGKQVVLRRKTSGGDINLRLLV